MATTSKQTRLREFQANLAERLRINAATPQDGNSKLGVRIGERNWLVDLAEAGEILSVPAIAPVPLTADWYRGLVNVRGNLISVVDLQQFSGRPVTPLEKDSRLLAFNTRLQFNGAILITRMLGLRNLQRMEGRPVAEGRPAWVGQDYQDNEGAVWTELLLSQLIVDEGFLRVGRHLAA
ncbi:MAG: chemotaxis protein CheW [Burkholderiaceae bacterium]|nr:MAG: chemotaxis protein CheW [Burkholderiaceae bacterium]